MSAVDVRIYIVMFYMEFWFLCKILKFKNLGTVYMYNDLHKHFISPSPCSIGRAFTIMYFIRKIIKIFLLTMNEPFNESSLQFLYLSSIFFNIEIILLRTWNKEKIEWIFLLHFSLNLLQNNLPLFLYEAS